MTQSNATFAVRLLEQACKQSASDIHFHPIPDKENVAVYFRLSGQKTFIQTIQTQLYRTLLTYFKYTSNMDIAEIRRPQNGIFHFQNKNKKQYSLRLSTLPLKNDESLTIRILPQEEKHAPKKLFLFPTQFNKMKKWLKSRAGMILFTGPTGSGKTTTMYALLESILQEYSFQVITLEDPIERKLDNVIQVEVNEKAGVSYQEGLRAALRHDPDILMVGEIRDPETAKFAFRAALTGHLVLSTLHARDAKGTIERLIDLGVNKQDILQTLVAVAAIELIPVVGKNNCVTRAAIGELLDGFVLEQTIIGEQNPPFQSFYHLREKAYVYGFITQEAYHKLH